mgnify:CR=1 FL=1
MAWRSWCRWPAGSTSCGWRAAGVPYNPEAALAAYARVHGLGGPLSGEEDVAIAGVTYRLQAFAGGIAYAPVGQWDRVRHRGW